MPRKNRQTDRHTYIHTDTQTHRQTFFIKHVMEIAMIYNYVTYKTPNQLIYKIRVN